MIKVSDPISYSELLHGLLMAICEDIHIDSKYPADIYGDNFENNTFKMNRECYCDSEECDMCSNDHPNFIHKPTGFKVWWYKYIGRGFVVQYDKRLMEYSDLINIFLDCLKSLRIDRIEDVEDARDAREVLGNQEDTIPIEDVLDEYGLN